MKQKNEIQFSKNEGITINNEKVDGVFGKAVELNRVSLVPSIRASPQKET
jgi:hypothetical protein